jgi:RNA-splicing ligase RtcB
MTIQDKIVSNLVGVDIGCGVLATKFRCLSLDFKKLDSFIKSRIPLGMNIHDVAVEDFTTDLNDLWSSKAAFNFGKVNRSIGSLGGGNHFISIEKDNDNVYYLLVHTGSRNFGKVMAEYYQEKAVEYHKSLKGLSKQEVIADLKSRGLQRTIPEVLASMKPDVKEEFCYLEGVLFNSYIHDMRIAQKFSNLNRRTIASLICAEMGWPQHDQFDTVHNYIDTDNMILRKGAISAQAGEKCMIPINMLDGSLVCVGKGNPDYNFSAPHGAGRLMSRNEAKKRLDLGAFQDSMKEIYSTTVNASTLDEAPLAYKPVAEILDNIKDTVDVISQIKPVYNIKASD